MFPIICSFSNVVSYYEKKWTENSLADCDESPMSQNLLDRIYHSVNFVILYPLEDMRQCNHILSMSHSWVLRVVPCAP